MALVITVDKLSEESFYLQVRRQIIAAIASGELRAGDALPSVRALAQDLGINLHTVNKAYATLRDEGYLVLLGRRGAFVADVAARPEAGLTAEELARRLDALATEFSASGGTAEEFLAAAEASARGVFERGGSHDC